MLGTLGSSANRQIDTGRAVSASYTGRYKLAISTIMSAVSRMLRVSLFLPA